jgi:hypothetical protein
MSNHYFSACRDIPEGELKDLMDEMIAREPQDAEADLSGEPISVYSDAQAVDDGVLVAFRGPGGVNRVTRAVFDHFTEPMGHSPLTNAVTNVGPLMDAIRAILKQEPDRGWRTGMYRGKTLWLVPNEVGGLTLMFPEDY